MGQVVVVALSLQVNTTDCLCTCSVLRSEITKKLRGQKRVSVRYGDLSRAVLKCLILAGRCCAWSDFAVADPLKFRVDSGGVIFLKRHVYFLGWTPLRVLTPKKTLPVPPPNKKGYQSAPF
jgi:hypothetical protein